LSTDHGINRVSHSLLDVIIATAVSFNIIAHMCNRLVEKEQGQSRNRTTSMMIWGVYAIAALWLIGVIP
jgi:hypothetical protein